jgi:hypothetical protein
MWRNHALWAKYKVRVRFRIKLPHSENTPLEYASLLPRWRNAQTPGGLAHRYGRESDLSLHRLFGTITPGISLYQAADGERQPCLWTL